MEGKGLLDMNDQQLMEFRAARKANFILGPIPGDVSMTFLPPTVQFDAIQERNGECGLDFGRSGNCLTPKAPQGQNTLYMSASDQMAPDSTDFHAGSIDFSQMESMDFTESTRISQYHIFPSTPRTNSLQEYELIESRIHLDRILQMFSHWDEGNKAKFIREFRGNPLLDEFLIHHFKAKGT